jgi:PST family polysaccharide transporter
MSLTQTAFAALKWNYAGTMVRMGANFAVGIILARLLGPKPYGQVAVAALVIGLGNLVADVGLGSALVQKDDVSSEDIRFAFTVQMVFALLIVGTIWPLAPWIALFFHQPETTRVLRAMFSIFILQALGQTAISLLKRNLQQKEIQTAQLLSYLVGYIVIGIPLAFLGAGVWSLVAAQVAQTLLNTTVVYLQVRHPIAPLFHPKNAHLARYGGKVVSSNVVNWWITNADNLFVGRACGGVPLGLYSRSFTLVNLPEAGVVSTLQAILFPAYSRTQKNPELMRQTYLASVSIVAMITMPFFAVVAAVPQSIIGGIYGLKWMAAVPVVVPLALAMALDSIMALAGPVQYGVGRVERELWPQITTAIVMVGMMTVMSRISFVAVGWGVLAIYLLRVALVTRAVIKTLELQWSDIARSLGAPVVVAAASALLVGGLDRVLLVRMPNIGLRLAFEVMTAGVGSLLFLTASFPLWTRETHRFLNQATRSSPALGLTIRMMSHVSSSFLNAARGEQG